MTVPLGRSRRGAHPAAGRHSARHKVEAARRIPFHRGRYALTCALLFAVSFLMTTLSGPDAGALTGLAALYFTRNWWRL